MSVTEVRALHELYVDLSDRFRAAWAFHQCIRSVEKLFLPDVAGKSSASFQDLYARIKSLSQNLNAPDPDRVRGEIDTIGRQLRDLSLKQLEEDSKVPPHFLRQFFQRVKSYDEKILTQLVKFYFYTAESSPWQPDRIDKVDYLLTRLGQDSVDSGEALRLRDRRGLNEILLGLWRVLDRTPPEDQLVETYRDTVSSLKTEVQQVGSLDELSDRNLIVRYREFKHSLGDLFFHPRVLEGILETNLLLHNTVNRLYDQEERRIIADYQRIFELEREVPVDQELDQELSQFRQAVERFEKQLEGRQVNLSDLAVIRERVRTLLPRLSEASRLDSQGGAPRDTGSYSISNPLQEVSREGTSEIAPAFERLMATLEEAGPNQNPRHVAVSRELYPFRLEAREVVAYRRLHSDPDCDRELERFLLESAALRVRINEEAEEIKAILDDTAVTGEGPVFKRARRTVRLADSFLQQFLHLIDRAVLVSDLQLAHHLQILRMRLMRDYSGLWLLSYRRFLPKSRAE
ncbi:MAG: hypothetical protein KDD47_13530 [Acidobacteria bacterium]|nr:hypothetical protein [Acidobacteriota bacterium]